MTQADLARASGLSPATVSSIARELRDEGWLDESARAAAARRSRSSRSAGVAVGIDFGHTHVRVAVADLAPRRCSPRPSEPLDVDHAADEGIALRRRSSSSGCSARSASAPDRVTGVGMGLPGPLRRDTGEVGDSAILPGWIGSRPEAADERASSALPVRVENDANLGALAEIVWGAGRGCTDVVYVKAATGVGAGLVLGGRLYHGVARHGRRARPPDDRRDAARSAAAATAAASRRSPAPRRCSSRCAAATARRHAARRRSRWRTPATTAAGA